MFEHKNAQNATILRDVFIFWTWQHPKRSNSARLPHFSKCKPSKTKNSARLPSKMESWVQSWQTRTNAFCDFSTPPVWSTAPGTKNWCQVIRRATPVTQNHLSKPEDLMLQNATPLRKSAPWPPNISDEHVFCTAPATRNASVKILFKCPTPASVFGNATKPSRFAHFCQKVHNPLRLPCESTSERPKVLRTPVGFLHFWLGNMLRAATACTFSTSELPKVVRTWCVLYIFTSTCASRHNGVHFFDISTSTSKRGPTLRCFVHFDLEMCFAPKRRALFRHLNFQKCSEHQVFCTFWLANVLRSGQLAPHPPL